MFRAINNFFSKQHDLLAIGLFIGASIALMLSELFNWFLVKYVTKVALPDGFWFTVISFFMLLFKFVCICYVLFGLERLYNRFVRKAFIQRTKGVVEQALPSSVALAETTTVNTKTVNTKTVKTNVVKTGYKDQTSVLTKSITKEPEASSGFVGEYLKDLDGDSSEDVSNELQEFDSLSPSDIDSPKSSQDTTDLFSVKYHKRDELRHQLDKLSKDDDGHQEMSTVDIIELLKEDLKKSNYQKHLSSIPVKKGSIDLKEDRVRSIIAKN